MTPSQHAHPIVIKPAPGKSKNCQGIIDMKHEALLRGILEDMYRARKDPEFMGRYRRWKREKRRTLSSVAQG
jgi:hypothetical protein